MPRSVAAASSSEAGKSQERVRHRHRGGGRVALVAPGDRVEERRRVADVTGERPDLVERAGEGDDPVAGDAAVRRLEPDDPGQRRRLADRAARVGPDPEGDMAGRDRDRRAAAAATGDRVEVPGVAHRAVGAVLVRRAHRELVHVRLAEDHRPGIAEPLGDVGVVWRDVALEDPRSGRRLAALDRDEVLEGDGDAEERRQRLEGAAPLRPGRGDPGVGRVGLAEGAFAVDRQPRVEDPVLALGDGEMRLGQ